MLILVLAILDRYMYHLLCKIYVALYLAMCIYADVIGRHEYNIKLVIVVVEKQLILIFSAFSFFRHAVKLRLRKILSAHEN